MIITRERQYGTRPDMLFFAAGKVIWIPVLLAGLWFFAGGYEVLEPVMTCSFRASTGIICPGCGGTRALYALLGGHLLQSIRYHPTVLLAVCLYIHFMLLYMYRRRLAGGKAGKPIAVEWYAYLIGAVSLGQWILKLLLLYPSNAR